MAEITSVLREKRVFPPRPAFSKTALVPSFKAYERIYKEALRSPEKFWAKQAAELLDWFKPWKTTLVWKPPFATWFAGGKINASYNCLDRHLATWRKNKAAIIWEGEPGDVRTLTYGQLHSEVCRFANAIKQKGVKKGDRVIIYMPMVPELAIAMLACTRIGAPHSIVFGGFSAESLRDRINDAGAKVVVTTDGGYRRGAPLALKPAVDEACAGTPSVEAIVVVKRTGQPIEMKHGRDHWWSALMATAQADCPPAKLDAEHPLFILYTSGTTGKPKGILHTTGGY
ncbi:MAG: AMP-binding protein, partial [Candidatus Saccharimonadales bacterium]